MKASAAVAAGVAALLLPCAALAQTPAMDAQRRSLVDRAVEASNAGNHPLALELLQQAGRILMRPGLRVSLAVEHQSLGQTALACESATHGQDEARSALGNAATQVVLQQATELVAQTCGAYGRVRLHLPSPVSPDVRVLVGDRMLHEVDPEGIAVVPPGSVQVSATVPGEAPFQQSVTVRAGEIRDLTVDFHRTVARVPMQVPAHDAPTPDTNHTLRNVSYVLFGLGGAALIVGAVEWGITSAQTHAIASANPLGSDTYASFARYDNDINANRALSFGDVCSRAASDTVDPAAVGAHSVCSSNATSRALTLGGMIAGGALVAGGIVAFVMGTSSTTAQRPSARSFDLVPVVGGGSLGARASWTF